MEIHTQWIQFRKGLTTLKDLKLPRHVLSADTSTKTAQFHGFADASEKAYAAAVYVRSVDKRGLVTVRLLCAKSKVAPVKKQTLPRLELCAARLLAQFMKQVQRSIQPSKRQLYLWTDSSIVLSWIRSESSSFKTFVANRIATIHELTDPKRWRHVRSEQNPADIGSRGTTPEELCTSEMWFNGPEFLKKPESSWPSERIMKPVNDVERKEKKIALVTSIFKRSIIPDMNHRNSFTFLQRTTAYILRFVQNLQSQRNNTKPRLSGPLKVEELQRALELIIKEVQITHFSEELRQLHRNNFFDARSKLASLTPFIDNKGIIRVGGRLQESDLKYDTKHPIILPHSHHFTRILLEHLHIKNLHAGPQALLAITRQQFWPLKAKTLASSIVHKCIRCARVKPRTINQLMGNLPRERIQPARPFTHVGIDFCGPVHIHYKLRGKKPSKAYIAVFVCFATKAVHLEVVSDLTTAAFISTLKRFVGRRGRPAKIFCDNATNFVGAKNELKEVSALVHGNEKQIMDHCSQQHIEWCQIPPRSPHFGGLWESAVKSTKYHLVRVLMGTSPTYDDLCTIMVEIEAILNSRPITPLSDNPNDMQALTPGHFLIGEPLNSLNNSETRIKGTLADRWRHVQGVQQEFWRRWSSEYLQELQSRNKWRTSGMPIKPGMLVLLKDENLPPLKWQLARVTRDYKGKDGLTRVVEVKTAKGGTFTRAITQICPLPVEASHEEDTVHSSNQTTLIAIMRDNTCQKINEVSRNMDRPNPLIHTTSSATSQPRPTIPQSSAKRRLKRRIAPINPAWLNSPHLRGYNKQPLPIPQTESEPASKGKIKIGIGQTLVSLLLIVNLILPTLSQPIERAVEQIPFTSNTGLYFEGLGQVHMITDEWNIIAYYDLEGYWKELRGLRDCLRQLTMLCENLKEYRDYCTTISVQLKHQLGDIEHGNDILLKTNDPTVRAKRSPFDIIGSISNKLFGILDQEYADKMTKTIENLENNENHLLDLIKNQTSVLDSTANIIKKSEEHIHRQFIHIQDYLEKLSTTIGNVTARMNEQKIMQIFNSLSLYTTLIIIGYERVQTALIEVFTDTRTGRLNPLLVTPQQLRQELSLIRENLPSPLSLPERLLGTSDTLNLYNIMTVQARITVQHAIFCIKVPLVNQEVFEAFHIVPVPMEVSNNTFIIQDVADVLIVNLLHDHYYPMNKFDFQGCLQGSSNDYLCRQHGTMYYKTTGEHRCELELLNQNRHLPSTCSLAATNRTNNWINLYNPNQWIYSFSKETTINVVCGRASFQERLQGQGLLVFKTNCLLRENMITISSHNKHPTIIRSSFASSISINSTAFEVLQQSLSEPRQFRDFYHSNTSEEIQRLQETIHQMKTQEHIRSTKDFSSTDIHHFSIAYLAFVLAVIILLYFVIVKLRKRVAGFPINNDPANPPQPASRNFEFQV